MKTLFGTVLVLLSLSSFSQEIVTLKMKSLRPKPIVKVEVNGKKLFFLVDTGSDISIINEADAQTLKLKEQTIYHEGHVAHGFNGTKARLKSIPDAEMVLGDDIKYTKFFSLNLTSVIHSLNQKTNTRISGIIGSDILIKYNCTIDYNQRSITMIHPKLKRQLAKK